MYLINKLNKCKYSLIPSLITMTSTDHDVLTDIASNKLYHSVSKYLDKLYFELRLCDHRWVKNLYEVDKSYARSKITDALGKVITSHIYAHKTQFIITSESLIHNYDYVVSKLRKADTVYKYCQDDYHSYDTFLGLYGNQGCIIEMSLATNKLAYYDIQLKDDMLLINKDTTIQLDDPKFEILIDSVFDMIPRVNKDYLFNTWLNNKLTYDEYIRMLKSLKLASGSSRLKVSPDSFTDNDYEIYANLEPYQYNLVLTEYTVSDVLKKVTSQLLNDTPCNIHDIYWIYNKILSDDLMCNKLINKQ